MTRVQKPQRGAVDLSRIDPRYKWYWDKSPSDSHVISARLGAWYWPLWEFGASNEVRAITNVDDPLGAIQSGHQWNVRGPHGDFGFNPNTGNGINFGNFFDFPDGATPWTCWAAFQIDDTDADDNALWTKFGSTVARQILLVRVDAGAAPQNVEVRFANVNVMTEDGSTDVIEENVPYLVVVSLDAGTTANMYIVDLATQQFVVDGDGGTINTGSSNPDRPVFLGSRETDADRFVGAIFAAGLIHDWEMTREQTALLARDIYGPIRPMRRKVRDVPAVVPSVASYDVAAEYTTQTTTAVAI